MSDVALIFSVLVRNSSTDELCDKLEELGRKLLPDSAPQKSLRLDTGSSELTSGLGGIQILITSDSSSISTVIQGLGKIQNHLYAVYERRLLGISQHWITPAECHAEIPAALGINTQAEARVVGGVTCYFHRRPEDSRGAQSAVTTLIEDENADTDRELRLVQGVDAELFVLDLFAHKLEWIWQPWKSMSLDERFDSRIESEISSCVTRLQSLSQGKPTEVVRQLQSGEFARTRALELELSMRMTMLRVIIRQVQGVYSHFDQLFPESTQHSSAGRTEFQKLLHLMERRADQVLKISSLMKPLSDYSDLLRIEADVLISKNEGEQLQFMEEKSRSLEAALAAIGIGVGCAELLSDGAVTGMLQPFGCETPGQIIIFLVRTVLTAGVAAAAWVIVRKLRSTDRQQSDAVGEQTGKM